MIIAAALTKLYLEAGPIQDPEFDIPACLKTLTAHNEALVATEAFIKYSDLPDREDAVYQSSPVNNLVMLIPDRIRIISRDVFKTSSCTYEAGK